MRFRTERTFWTEQTSEKGVTWEFKILLIQVDAPRSVAPTKMTLSSPVKIEVSIGDLFDMEKRAFQRRL